MRFDCKRTVPLQSNWGNCLFVSSLIICQRHVTTDFWGRFFWGARRRQGRAKNIYSSTHIPLEFAYIIVFFASNLQPFNPSTLQPTTFLLSCSMLLGLQKTKKTQK